MPKNLTITFLIIISILFIDLNLYSNVVESKNLNKKIYEKIFEDRDIEKIEILYLKNNIAIVKGILEENWIEYVYLVKLEKLDNEYNVKEAIELKTDLIINSVKVINIKNLDNALSAGYKEIIEIASYTHSGNGFLQLFNFNGYNIFTSESKFYDAHFEETFYNDENIDKKIVGKLEKLPYLTYSIINKKENNYLLNINYNYDKKNGIMIYGKLEYTVFEDYDSDKIKVIATEDIKEYYNFDKKNSKWILQKTESVIKIKK